MNHPCKKGPADAEQLEALRKQLFLEVERHQGDLLHPAVVAVSQQLDQVIARIQTRLQPVTACPGQRL